MGRPGWPRLDAEHAEEAALLMEEVGRAVEVERSLDIRFPATASAATTAMRHLGAACPNHPAGIDAPRGEREHAREDEPDRQLVEAVEYARRDQADREPAERAAAGSAEVVGGERTRGWPQAIELTVQDHADREQEQSVARDLELEIPAERVDERGSDPEQPRDVRRDSRPAARPARTGSGSTRAEPRSRRSVSRDRSRAGRSRGTGCSRSRDTGGW